MPRGNEVRWLFGVLLEGEMAETQNRLSGGGERIVNLAGFGVGQRAGGIHDCTIAVCVRPIRTGPN
jgi:hypothetical protein